MILRREHKREIRALLDQFPVVGLVGARQVGKTTLARDLINAAPEPVTIFDLEDSTDERRFADPKLVLESLRGMVVIDEVQRSEGLFRLLRVLVDRPGNPVRFLVLGSAGPNLLRQSSETLAGRIAYYELPPFRISETGTGAGAVRKLWLRGGFPRSFLADGDDRASGGGSSSFARFLNAICPSWESPCRQLRCAGSGPCWPTTMAIGGTAPNSAAPSGSPPGPSTRISTRSSMR